MRDESTARLEAERITALVVHEVPECADKIRQTLTPLIERSILQAEVRGYKLGRYLWPSKEPEEDE